MSETLVQKRIRKMRDRAEKKKNFKAKKKKVQDDRELTLHQAHCHTRLCRLQHEGRKSRSFSRFEKPIDNTSHQAATPEEVLPEMRMPRRPQEPFVPTAPDEVIDLTEYDQVFDLAEAKQYLNTGFSLVG